MANSAYNSTGVQTVVGTMATCMDYQTIWKKCQSEGVGATHPVLVEIRDRVRSYGYGDFVFLCSII